MRMTALVLVLLALARIPASAVTADQIVALSKAGVSDTVLLALIDRDKSVFAIEPEQIIDLKQAGLSEAVVLAMLKSGRPEAPVAEEAAPPLFAGPNLVIIGHDPDVPNTSAQYPVIYVPPAMSLPYTFLVQPPRPRPLDRGFESRTRSTGRRTSR